MQNKDINNNLRQGVKIRERGGQVKQTKKATTFCQVCHPYMLRHNISGNVVYMKDVALSLVSSTRQIACTKTIYTARYAFYTEIVQVNDNILLKNT